MSRVKYVFVGVVAGVSFGTAAIFIRFIKGISYIDIAFWRLIIGGSILLALNAPFMNKTGLIELKNSLKSVSLMGIFLALHFIFFIKSIADTFVLNATILVNTAPVITLVIAWLFKRDKIERRDVIATLLAFFGVLTTVNFLISFRVSVIGDIEAFLASILISLYAIVGREIRREGDIPPFILASVIYYSAIPVVLLANFIMTGKLFSVPVGMDLIFVILLGLIPTGIGHTLMIYALKGLKSYEAQIFGLIEPIAASILALLIFSEIPPLTSIIGSMFIIIGIFLISYKGREQVIELHE